MRRTDKLMLVTGAFLVVQPLIGLPQKNVLIIYPEDMSMHLSSLGTPGIQTPALDEFANQGTRFSANFCPQPVCSPSKGGFYTGRYPHDNGMTINVHNFPVNQLPIPPDEDPSNMSIPGIKEEIPTLIEILNQEGYFTAITSKTHVQPMRKFRFDFGWGDTGSYEKPEVWKDLISKITNQAGSQPFFFMANTPLTHASDKHKRLIANGISSNPEDRLAPPTTVDWREVEIPPFLPDTEVARKDIARYYALVQVVDEWANVLLQALDEAGLADSTLVIFSPDHGMGYQRGKVSCYPAGTQVPLIIRGPGVKQGQTIDAPVNHVDLMATILEFLDIEAPEIQHGRSLWPLLRGEITEFPDRKTILTTTNAWYQARAVTDGKWYYVRNFTQPYNVHAGDDPWSNPPMNIDLWIPDHPNYDNQVFSETIRVRHEQPLPYKLLAKIVEGRLPEEELFNLEADPWATQNLAGDNQYLPVLEFMRSELKQWQKKTNDKW